MKSPSCLAALPPSARPTPRARAILRRPALLAVLSFQFVGQLAALLAGTGCADGPRGLLSGTASPPPEIQQACALATTKCARCHPIERVTVERGIGPGKWAMYVEQMRLKPSSGITPNDARTIFQCLRFVDESCTNCKQGPS